MKSLILFVRRRSQWQPNFAAVASAAQAKPTLIKLALDCLLCLLCKGERAHFPQNQNILDRSAPIEGLFGTAPIFSQYQLNAAGVNAKSQFHDALDPFFSTSAFDLEIKRRAASILSRDF